MVKQEHISATAPTTFQFKGSLFTLTVLQLKTLDMCALAAELAATVQSSPNFFNYAPVVLDIQSFAKLDVDIDFSELQMHIRNNQLIPVGIRGGSEAQQRSATSAGFAVFPNTRHEPAANTPPEPSNETPPPSAPEAAAPTAGSKTRVITQPVRSGQQIYAQGGDLLILGPVSPGAELLADGNIHVYGALRGRALAGVQGDVNAHIFCQDLDAELISIAGRYQLSEQIKSTGNGQTTHIFLRDEQLHTESF